MCSPAEARNAAQCPAIPSEKEDHLVDKQGQARVLDRIASLMDDSQAQRYH